MVKVRLVFSECSTWRFHVCRRRVPPRVPQSRKLSKALGYERRIRSSSWDFLNRGDQKVFRVSKDSLDLL